MAEMAPGSVFAGHRIETVAGRGGMGVVYRATQLALDRTVALKVIAPGLIEDDSMRKRFVRESKVAASIDHPNVIPIYYAGEEDGVAYIAMRYVAGDDLRSLVRREKRLEPRRAVRIVAQVGAALDAAHAAGLVHRDVKPANVLLGPDDHVYLTDFGLTKHALSVGGATKPGQWVGTLDYVAPEQIRGERIDARADVYALGCVLFYTLTGAVPFPREGDQAKLWAHLSEPPPRAGEQVAGLPPELDEVVARALAKKPDERFPSAGDAGRAAVAAVAGERPQQRERLVAVGPAAPVEAPTVAAGHAAPTRAVPESEAETAVQADPGRRRVGVAAVVAGALAAGIALGALLLGTGGDESAPGGATPAPTATAGAAGQPRVAAQIEVGNRPNVIAANDRRVFVGSFREQRLALLDPETNAQGGRGPAIGVGASDIAVSDRAVWVTVARQRRLLRLDPRTGRRVGGAIELPSQPNSVTITASAVWVGLVTPVPGQPDRLLKIAPRTGAIEQTLMIPEGVAALAAGASSIWIASRRRALLSQLDPRTGTITRRVALGRDDPADVAYGAGAVWVTTPGDDLVSRVDPRTGNVVQIAVGQSPQGIAAARDGVWVANRTANTVTRIDPSSSRPAGDPIPVALNPYAVALGAGSVWVACTGENRVVRIEA